MTAAGLRLAVFALWLLASAILLWIARDNIAGLTMWDPDDYLRLQQVRDLLGGQAFLDVTQYRLDPPQGVAMHWSRIVDLPIAALILLLQPLFGAVLAERVAACAVPLITFGGTLAALALIGARLADRRTALIAAMLSATAPMMLFHVMPLRIDHHGWQTVCGLFAVAACFDPRARRGGWIAGTMAALWLAISLEGLPMVAAIAGLLALRFVAERDGEGAAIRFRAFAAALAVAGLILFAGFHGRAAWSELHCDAAGPAWFGPLALAPALVAIGLPLVVRRGIVARIALLLLAAAIGVGLLALTAPACLGGPFAALDPLVRSIWYANVLEGLPVWKQPIDNANMLIGFPLIGIAGTLFGWRRASTKAASRDWLAMLALLLAAFAVSLLVQRAGAFAHGCALPGAAFLLTRLLDAIGRWRRALLRILASALAILALSPVGAMAAGSAALSLVRKEPSRQQKPPACPAPCARFTALAKLPPAYILAGLDLTPELLVRTPHFYVGSPHHRGLAGIRRVILVFTGKPETARRIMAQHGIDYLLIDPAANEVTIYTRAAPHGLMAELIAGKPPVWLEPVPLAGSPLKLWRRVS